MATTGKLPALATYWRGDELGWLERLSLYSFLRKGHPVTLFHPGPRLPNVPEGVEQVPAAEIRDTFAEWEAGSGPNIQANVFRMYMLARTDLIWIDADILCLHPLTYPGDGYLFGLQADGLANNALLRLPKDSPALADYIALTSDPSAIPPWTPGRARRIAEAAEPGRRLATACANSHSLLGPFALTNLVKKSGEWSRVLPEDVLNPLPWYYADLPFNPHGGTEAWLTANSLVLHLYHTSIRPIHKRRAPDPNSYVGRFAARIGFEF